MTILEIAKGYAEILQRIQAGDVFCVYTGPSWNEVYAGEVSFECDGWHFVIFNDCDTLDYTDSVTAPDGSKATFDELFDAKLDPMCFIPFRTKLNMAELELRLKRAQTKGE